MSDSEQPPCKISRCNGHPSSEPSGGAIDETFTDVPVIKRTRLEEYLIQRKAEVYDLRKALAEKDIIVAKLKSDYESLRDRFMAQKFKVFNKCPISLRGLAPPYHYLEKDEKGQFSLKRKEKPDFSYADINQMKKNC